MKCVGRAKREEEEMELWKPSLSVFTDVHEPWSLPLFCFVSLPAKDDVKVD